MIFDIKNIRLVLTNIYYLLRFNIKEAIIEQRQMATFSSILSLSGVNAEFKDQYEKEINKLKKTGKFTIYPSQTITQTKVESGYDAGQKMNFIVHKNKRLYFPSCYNKKQAIKKYYEIADCDKILSCNNPGTPHQYQSEKYSLKEGDVLIDIGCAEALFALDNIHLISRAILVERDREWIKALKATFAPYREKVVIINKYISDKDSSSSVTLETLLKNLPQCTFIKMDIEGNEVKVLESSKSFLSGRDNIVISCCTYHNNEDGALIEKIYEEIDYKYEYSSGYMLFARYDTPTYPFFRHGVIRARKKS